MKSTLPWFGSPQAGASSPLKAVKNVLLTGLLLVTAGSMGGCLNRPVCGEEVGQDGSVFNTCVPQTTNVIVQKLVQQSVDKIDMLFVIDNSISMADKQKILVQALPDLVNRFVSPICVDANGAQVSQPQTANEDCPEGSSREFSPIDDIHIGVVTTSLGGYGSPQDCVFSETSPNSEQKIDLAHLLGSLPRGAAAGGDFLKWTADSNAGTFSSTFGDLVQAAGEHGCGWEASLEAWYRFLIEPFPYQNLERVNCPFGGDTKQSCIGPTTNDSGEAMIDSTILSQRAEFLRPDSLVAIIMLSDENDCSFRANGQSWRLAQAFLNEFTINSAFKGSATCAADPNSNCCHSCGAPPPEGCPTGVNEKGDTVGTGCEDSRRYDVPQGDPNGNPDDQINLRCFEQKRRFGVDYLYPVERYSNALREPRICPFADDLDPARCQDNQLVDNPLFDDLTLPARLAVDPEATRETARAKTLVFLAGIVGVPWQDVAVSPNPQDELVYRVASEGAEDDKRINWDWIVGPVLDGVQQPAMDPLMIESVDPRSGTNPATGEALADASGGQLANSINGHEWNIALRQDLQYACIFPKEETNCADPAAETDASLPQPNCDCTEFGSAAEVGYNNPLCQAADGTYDLTQRYAKAYPSLRQLQVLRDYGNNSIVASICPKEVNNTDAPDFGYRPAVGSIVERLKEQLADKCLPRELSLRADKSVECRIIEAKKQVGNLETCEQLGARDPVPENVQVEVRKSLEDSGTCAGEDCKNFRMCEIKQLLESDPGAGLQQCLNNADNVPADGWCYIDPLNPDPAKQVGSAALVEKCQATEKRKLRFVGKGTPDNGTVTFVACAGAVLDGT